jgi:hypothetical protein
MIKAHFFSFTAIIAFNFMPLTLRTCAAPYKAPHLATINPTVALTYYSLRELERVHCAIMSNYSAFEKTSAEIGEPVSKLASKRPRRALFKHYESIPAGESTSDDYWNDFLSCALPVMIKSTSKVTKMPEAKILNDDNLFSNLTQGIMAHPSFIKILCIVRTIQRESQQHININDAIDSQDAACTTFATAVQNKQATLKLTEENEELEHIWKNFKMPSNQRLQQILEEKRREMQPNTCLLL